MYDQVTQGQAGNRLLVLDIDLNLMVTNHEDNMLSRSAAGVTSPLEDSGGKASVQLFNGHDFPMNVHAIEKDKWRAFFKAIVENNKQEDKPKIYLRFLTNATYSADAFYEHVFKEIFLKDFSVEDIRLLMPVGIENSFDNRHDNFFSQVNRLDAKGAFMNVSYPRWPSTYGITNRENVVLVDDNDDNIHSARRYGFSTIHNPTNHETRPVWVRYKHIFGKLYDWAGLDNPYPSSSDSDDSGLDYLEACFIDDSGGDPYVPDLKDWKTPPPTPPPEKADSDDNGADAGRDTTAAAISGSPNADCSVTSASSTNPVSPGEAGAAFFADSGSDAAGNAPEQGHRRANRSLSKRCCII